MDRQEIMQAVQRHHEMVESKGYHVVMTSLVGSQNYCLDTENSDIDTYSFILPSFEELARGDSMKAGLIIADDGHCNFKDIRVALNLLKKASPNSVEYFASKYKVYNPLYQDILEPYLEYDSNLSAMVHCNYGHMLGAIAGMARQLTERNMPAGKRFSHALRLDDMVYNFFNSEDGVASILELRPGGDRDLALHAKLDTDPANDNYYNTECEAIAKKLANFASTWQTNQFYESDEREGMELINELQNELFKRYLMETIK